MDIKEIALCIDSKLCNEGSVATSADYAIKFATALLAEVQKQNEPVAYRWKERERWLSWYVDWTWHDKAKSLGFPIEYAYTFPPSVEAIENKVAEACAEFVKCGDHEYDPLVIARKLSEGEWRKHMKGE